ncbi:MAG: DUF2508 family protein [Clostridia bacterium]|nr:DUF2508 family protein [Clostridia bacterium]MBR2878566.1 DUF2508 family protein [Clostridia bacterium]MBR2974032.1 DUF2508 family protein [Clostridia bacterium]
MKINKKLEQKKLSKQREIKRAYLLTLIANAQNHLHTVGNGFDETTNEDLTEYFIYERRAAEIKYRHLLKMYINEKFDSTPLIVKTVPTSSETELINEA